MTVKEGASIAKLTPVMRAALGDIEACYAAYGAACVVTSGDEASTIHRGRPVLGGVKDPHYEGLALDFRLWNVTSGAREALVQHIATTLGEGFVVIWEIGPHTLYPGADDHWTLTCGADTDSLRSPLPENCARCGKALQGATPHVHIQTKRADVG